MKKSKVILIPYQSDKEEGKANLFVQDGIVVSSEDENMHIRSVCVFAGNDDGEITDFVEMVQKGDNVDITNHPHICKKYAAPSRMRGELGVTINLTEEQTDRNISVTVSHHKGAVFISTDYTNKKPLSLASLHRDLRQECCAGCGTRNPAHFDGWHENFCVSCGEINREIADEVAMEEEGIVF